MYTQVSEEFKEIVKSNAITATAKLVFKEPNITIINKATDTLKSSLKEVTITDNCCDKGQLIGNAMAKEVEVSIVNKDNLDLADKEFELFVGVKLANGEYEYVPYGNYIVTKYQDTKSNNIFNIVAYDYMSKLNGEFKTNTNFKPTFPLTLKEFKKQFVESYGLYCVDQILPNDNFMVKAMPGFEGSSGRTVLAKIAELQGCFAKVTRDNRVRFTLINETNEKIDAMSMNSKLDINKAYGPVNVVSIGLRNVEGENVTLQDVNSIKQNGETAIKIESNPFTYTQELREQAIQELYNKLNGFTYIPVKFNYKARLYTDCGDTIQVENVENKQFVKTILLNQRIRIPSTRKSVIDTPAITKTGVKNKYIPKTEQQNAHTEIVVDKINQKITSVVEQIGDRSNKKTTITQDIDGISSKVEEIESIYKVVEGIGKISISDNVKDGKIVELHIYGNNTVFNLYPRKDLFPEKTRFPSGGDSILVVKAKDKPTVEHDLKIKGVLRQNGSVYDEYVLKNGKAKVIRRINTDGTIKEIPEETPLTDFEIPLYDGENTIEIKGYTAQMKATYVPKNGFVDSFATKVEMNSAIEQSATDITTTVNKTLENYSTTTEMNSAIKQSADSINAEVKKKVGKDEIGTQIEQNAESVRLAWNGVSQNIQFAQEGGNAKIEFKEDTNNKLMELDKSGQHFFKNGNTMFGEMGVKRVQTGPDQFNDFVSFSVPIEKNATIKDGMSWGATLPNGTFIPILYIKDFQNFDNGETSAVWGNMVLNGCNLELAGPMSSIKAGGVKINAGFIGMQFIDEENNDVLLSIAPGLDSSIGMYNDQIRFYNNSGGTKTLLVGDDTTNKYCILESTGYIYGFNITANNEIYCYGDITAVGNIHANGTVSQGSLESIKKNIEKYNDNAIEQIKNTDIYKFNYKTEKDTDKKHVGFIIGDKYKASKDIIAEENKEPKGADLYSMISVAYKAIQEQQETIEKLQKQVDILTKHNK